MACMMPSPDKLSQNQACKVENIRKNIGMFSTVALNRIRAEITQVGNPTRVYGTRSRARLSGPFRKRVIHLGVASAGFECSGLGKTQHQSSFRSVMSREIINIQVI